MKPWAGGAVEAPEEYPGIPKAPPLSAPFRTRTPACPNINAPRSQLSTFTPRHPNPLRRGQQGHSGASTWGSGIFPPATDTDSSTGAPGSIWPRDAPRMTAPGRPGPEVGLSSPPPSLPPRCPTSHGLTRSSTWARVWSSVQVRTCLPQGGSQGSEQPGPNGISNQTICNPYSSHSISARTAFRWTPPGVLAPFDRTPVKHDTQTISVAQEQPGERRSR